MAKHKRTAGKKSISLVQDRALRNAKRSFDRGFRGAAELTLRYCAEHKLTAPAWALEGWAFERNGQDAGKGLRRSPEHPWTTMLRIMAVEHCARNRFLHYVAKDRYNDKYSRAARYLRHLAKENPRRLFGLPVLGGAKAIEKTYLRFKRTGVIGGIPLFTYALSDRGWAKLHSVPMRPH